MCLTFFCIYPENSCPYRFVLAFNRDEEVSRETIPFGAFQQDPFILAGRDVISKGSWLGINIKIGVVVILTNYFQLAPKLGKSRGTLVYHFLKTQTYSGVENTEEKIRTDLTNILKGQEYYSPFNLIVYDVKSNNGYYINNQKNLSEPRLLLRNSNYGLCNIDIDTIWPKTQHGLNLYSKVMSGNIHDQSKLLLNLQEIMRDDQSFSETPEFQQSIFLHPYFSKLRKAQRCTKSSTLILITQTLDLTVREITHSQHPSQFNYNGKFQL